MSLSRMTIMGVGVKSLRARLKGDIHAVAQAQMEESEYDDFPSLSGASPEPSALARREGRGAKGSGYSRKGARG